jgi:glycosyltransferase involved in cell wall biosynthesis
VIEGVADRVVAVYKENGGQGSAFNAGFANCGGDIVIFLDADDLLEPDAVEVVMGAFVDDSVVKVHWPLRLVDARGTILPGLMPDGPLPSGDLGTAVLQGGPTSSLSPPTSGNAWRRDFLEQIFPVPEDVYRLCADEYLYTLAPVFGLIAALDARLAFYRLHGSNNYSALSPRQKLTLELDSHSQQCAAVAATLLRNGIKVDLERWHQGSWFHRLQRAIDQVESDIPAGTTFALADGDTWGADGLFSDRQVVAANSLTKAGGPPADDTHAMELVPIVAGFDYLVFGWPSFWWFEQYPRFFQALASQFEVASESEVARIFARRLSA